MTLLRLRDSVIAILLYLTACALVSDAQQPNRRESIMSTPSAAPTPALSLWHPHTEEPDRRIQAIILLQPPDADPVTLPELYVWDTEERYWISASSHLRIRHAVFFWSELYPLRPESPVATPWRRDEEATAGLLSLVGIDVDGDSVVGWEDHQVQDAEDWAAAVHLRASDNAVPVPPMPMFLRDLSRTTS